MKTSQNGINLIKQFEGCRLQAYKPVAAEQYYTIGYGHYGPDVAPGAIITQDQAEAYLLLDLQKFEDAVNALGLNLSQNQFDSLVSFAYNCGAGNLKRLVSGRTLPQIADAMLSYCKGSGKVLPGLVRRREAERALFLMGVVSQGKVPGVNHNPYKEPTKNVRLNSKGNDVRWCQYSLNTLGYHLIVDGIFKEKTLNAVIAFQKSVFPNDPKEWDGIVGAKTREKLKNNM